MMNNEKLITLRDFMDLVKEDMLIGLSECDKPRGQVLYFNTESADIRDVFDKYGDRIVYEFSPCGFHRIHVFLA